MEIEKLPEHREEKKPQPSGQWLWKNLKPFGCILCLVLMVAMIAVCLTAGGDPIPGYEPPYDGDYYAGNMEALETELEANVLPRLEGIVSCERVGDKIVLTIEEAVFAKSRSAVIQYFDIELFEFVMG